MNRLSIEELERRIRTVPDFPRPGISFKDITPIIEDGEALHAAVDALAEATEPYEYDRILSAEARGFVFGTALSYRARKGLILARKPNKLPRRTISASYELEYGTDALETHADSIPPGTRVLVTDDLLATGGTARAMCELVENAGGVVAACAFLIELRFLDGRSRLSPYPVVSLISYDEP
ncbi:MAG: adenine phosphoribosyltransferase [Rubrobacteraceae bacterium]|uniref:adenine phosphoribosyltransferase n=1 Tax=Rubrobacter naiadicus TaxID=1392641 RepID=UPI002362B97A|nr:adenine phosphoribosyltransferase [Rubrobacter naiadicus]MBX6764801.1 adenine phosphoribosyltransferase [Rubrobacteraceae bacterium]MCL6438152.1 adenine phosphoribosyltransferase [Rubrobacteraceae bacterium]